MYGLETDKCKNCGMLLWNYEVLKTEMKNVVHFPGNKGFCAWVRWLEFELMSTCLWIRMAHKFSFSQAPLSEIVLKYSF